MKNMERLNGDLVKFIQKYKETSGRSMAVIGISGGAASAIAAAVCVEALGENNVIGVLLPNGLQADIKDAYYVCNHLNIPHMTIDINRSVVDMQSELKDNIDFTYAHTALSRFRETMVKNIRNGLLDGIAEVFEAFVVDPVDLTKRYFGYAPTSDSVKPFISFLHDDVLELGRYLQIPDSILSKKPAINGTPYEDMLDGITFDDIKKYNDGQLDNLAVGNVMKILHKKSEKYFRSWCYESSRSFKCYPDDYEAFEETD